MNQQKIEFQKYRDFGQVINGTFEFIRHNFLPLLKSIIFIVGPFILLSGIFSGLYQKDIFSFNSTTTSLSNFGIVSLLYLIALFLSMITMVSVVYSYVLIYLERTDESPIQIDEVWLGVKSNILKVVGITILIGIIIGVIGITFFLPLFFIFNVQSNPLAMIPIIFLVMIPIIYFSNKLTLTYFVSLYENIGAVDSMKRSIFLIKNKWWFTFGLVIVLSFIQGFMGFLFQIPQYIAMITVMFNSMDGTGVDGVTEIIIIITSIIAAFNFVFYAISLIAIAFHYFSLVEQKEAKGLIEKIESI
ncbi:MAG: hypothetical protein IPH97_04335 [Ignavibacteriales bacterium]|nr:hypothetical protein [Ignavibacteriales bacterium]